MALAKRSFKKGMGRMGKIQMRKMQKNNTGKRKATRSHKASGKHKKGLSKLDDLLQKIIYRCFRLPSIVLGMSRKKDKKRK
jgi:hypothetical protein